MEGLASCSRESQAASVRRHKAKCVSYRPQNQADPDESLRLQHFVAKVVVTHAGAATWKQGPPRVGQDPADVICRMIVTLPCQGTVSRIPDA